MTVEEWFRQNPLPHCERGHLMAVELVSDGRKTTRRARCLWCAEKAEKGAETA